MFNKGGISQETLVNVKQILANASHYMSVGAVIDNTVKNSDGVALAGTPLYGDITSRDGGANAFVKPTTSGDTKGVWTVQITTAFANDEVITIGGVAYTKKASESVANRQFEGATAATQVTSLLKMVTVAGFTVGAVDGATDKIGFTQVVADASGSAPTATESATTGAIGSVTEVTTPVTGTNNANCVLLSDVEFSGSADVNGVVLVHGMVDLSKMDSTVRSVYSSGVIASLRDIGIYAI